MAKLLREVTAPRPVSRACTWLLISVLVISQPGCGLLRGWRKRKPPADAEAVAQARRPLQRMGVVTLVNEADGFVLIDSGSQPTPAVGARLQSYTARVVSGQLKASVVRRRPFVVADIVEGTPRVGDEIFETVNPVAVVAKP